MVADVAGFIDHSFISCLYQELEAYEPPVLMTLVDGPRADNQICVAYKNQFDLMNEKNGDTLQLFKADTNKVGA